MTTELLAYLSDAGEGKAVLESDVLMVFGCLELTLAGTLEMVRRTLGVVGPDLPSPERCGSVQKSATRD